MNLILINISEEQCLLFINNLKFDKFVNAWGPDTAIKISEFYGYNEKNYFYKTAVEVCKNLQELKSFIEENSVKIINNLEFESKQCHVEVNDMYNYTAKTRQKEYLFLSKILFETTDFDLFQTSQPEKLMNRYLLVNGQQIIKQFSSFDEYLDSEFDEQSST